MTKSKVTKFGACHELSYRSLGLILGLKSFEYVIFVKIKVT